MPMLLLLMMLPLSSCTTTTFDKEAEKIEATDPVKIELPMPSIPTYPQEMVWEKIDDNFVLTTSDMDRLIT